MKKIILLIAFGLLLACPSWAASLDKPQNLNVSVRNAKNVKLVWSEVSGATKYKVKVAVWHGKKVKLYKKVKNNHKWIRGLKTNKRYWTKVKACNKKGCGKYSDWEDFRTDPAKPKNVRVTNLTYDSVTVHWNQVRGKHEYYEVKLMAETGEGSFGVQTTGMDAESREYSGLDHNTTYRIRVRGIYNYLNEGKWSKAVKFTTPQLPTEG